LYTGPLRDQPLRRRPEFELTLRIRINMPSYNKNIITTHFINKMFRHIQRLVTPFTSRSFGSLINKRLAKSLEKEYEYEKSQYKVDESVTPFLKESGFDLIDLEGTTRITLKKKIHGNEVEVTFSARSPYGLDQEDSAEKGEKKEEEEDEQPESEENGTEFQVLIKKSGRKEGLIYECVSSQSEIQINTVVYNDDVSSISRFSTYASPEYRGPEFDTLDEKLQTAFVEYMKTHGIDEDLAVFVETYSLDKEHRLYMEWLNNMKEFVSD
jgi:complement component 1 Q subcomponent-binding protein, mitochondrial